MYKVYWTNTHNGESYGKEIGNLIDALAECKMLRDSGRSFVTMVSENPDSVGKPGVTDVGPDYDWKKRRI
jgi:hypothetical protein